MTTRTALVTGAARGIGLATIHRFLREGWNVVAVDRDADALEDAMAARQDVLSIVADVSNPDDAARIADETESRFGRLDALVNNAGVAEFAPVAATDFAMWRRVMDTNLDGVFLMSQAATPLLARPEAISSEPTTVRDSEIATDGKGGRASACNGAIVNIASISGLRASTLRLAYGTSKAAVIQFTLQQAAELGEVGIRANAVAPGPVATKLAMAVHSREIIDAYHDALPLNRYGREEEIANAIWFLCSDEASFVTGQVLAADGGFGGTGVGLPALRK